MGGGEFEDRQPKRKSDSEAIVCRLSDWLKRWCSASERDPTIIEAQLDHLDYDLRNAYHKIGEQLNAATMQEEARNIFAPYVDADWIVEGKIRLLTEAEARVEALKTDAGQFDQCFPYVSTAPR
ncbi:MAG: hypothetical protein ABWZ01_06875 [Methyloceanibacter sp.]